MKFLGSNLRSESAPHSDLRSEAGRSEIPQVQPEVGICTFTSTSGRRQVGVGFRPEFSGRFIPASGRFISAWEARQEMAVGGSLIPA